MPSLGPVLTNGEGHVSLGGAQAVEHLELRLITDNPPQTRYVGTMYPRGVWHVGSAGLGLFPGDGSGVSRGLILYSEFLHAEEERWSIPQPVGPPYTATSVWWRWLGGVTVEITVFW